MTDIDFSVDGTLALADARQQLIRAIAAIKAADSHTIDSSAHVILARLHSNLKDTQTELERITSRARRAA
jgi:hypothetical protein